MTAPIESAPTIDSNREPSSFRDDHGYVFWADFAGRQQIYRAILASGAADFAQMGKSGLTKALTEAGLLVRHQELPAAEARHLAPKAATVIRPDMVPFISYPYEWSWSQLRDAALSTLRIQKIALDHGMSLRDATTYNIQFVGGRPQMIDTLSFEPHKPKEPWIAYQQFCQHFLAPLALASYCDVDLMQLSRVYIDGVPLSLAANLLPRRSRFKIGLATHIITHARLQSRHQSDGASPKPDGKKTQPVNVSAHAMVGLIASLERTIRKLPAPSQNTVWADYYAKTNYDNAATEAKAKIVAEYCARLKPSRLLDLGSNDGRYSRVAAAQAGIDFVISADIDPSAVEHNYRNNPDQAKVLPLRIDLTNPSPAIGWDNRERASFKTRAQSDTVLALALIHHLAIANNVPLTMIAGYFADLAPGLIIEFVPKTDSQVQKLLATREDIFTDYTQAGFEAAFGQFFSITAQQALPHSKRVIYLMQRKSQNK